MLVAAGMFWSYSATAWLGVFFHLPDGRLLLRYELTWLRVPPDIAAIDVRNLERQRDCKLAYIAAQPEIFPSEGAPGGETVSQTFQRCGLPLREGDKDLANGYARLRSWLHPRQQASGEIGPSLIVHPECRWFLRTLPTLVEAPRKPDMIEDTPNAYPAKGAVYFVMSRPSPKPAIIADLPPGAIGHDVERLRAAARDDD